MRTRTHSKEMSRFPAKTSISHERSKNYSLPEQQDILFSATFSTTYKKVVFVNSCWIFTFCLYGFHWFEIVQSVLFKISFESLFPSRTKNKMNSHVLVHNSEETMLNNTERYDRKFKFTPSGGEVPLNDNGTILLNVPEGAFTDDTIVYCEWRIISITPH